MANQTIASMVRETIQTQPDLYMTPLKIFNEVKLLNPKIRRKNVSHVMRKLHEKGILEEVGKIQSGKGRASPEYAIAKNAQWDKLKTRKPPKSQTVPVKSSINTEPPKKELPPAEPPKDEMTPTEVGSAIIDLINSYKKTIQDMGAEISSLKRRLQRSDDIALEMVRDAKLERNKHYQALISDYKNSIRNLNKKIEILNTSRNMDSQKTFKLGDLAHIRK